MNIAASSICWAGDSRAGVLSKASEAGFEYVELLLFPREIWDLHGDLRTLTPAGLKKELDDAGLKLAAIHLGAIMTPTEAKRRTLTDYCKLALEFAVELDCGIIVDGGPNRAREPFEPFLQSLEELQPCFERTPVKLALENHYGNSIQFSADYDKIFGLFPSTHIGMTLDTGHFTAAGVDPVAIARRFAPRVFHVHVKDHIGTQSMALGAGQTDNTGVVRELRAAGYRGFLSQELEVHDRENADRYAREGRDYLARLAAAEV
jgi:sugar phosphate isomerase/epimerase